MENTDVPIQNDESTPIVESITKTTPTPIINGETPITDDTVKINGEQPIIEEPSGTENTEIKEDEIVPSTTKLIDEQENTAGTNTIITPTCVSPGRVNVPLKEVNESEKEEPAIVPITNGTENTISKKRELEQEDEQPEETTNDNDERTIDQTKKIKITEVTDTPIIETKESENNIIVNGNTAVEV
jgi:hypothetical protein